MSFLHGGRNCRILSENMLLFKSEVPALGLLYPPSFVRSFVPSQISIYKVSHIKVRILLQILNNSIVIWLVHYQNSDQNSSTFKKKLHMNIKGILYQNVEVRLCILILQISTSILIEISQTFHNISRIVI